ncbi:glycerophosphodiester phosphodiesterase [Rosenbergiella epipactidis]|uniref:glycerophosphodiester phosphodiesterase n=1 Tax=Rosenbergiella epipactidis TaxID=1544694 RepID=UPI00240E0B98|nr:glycerophosphodiester phosphodiesterase [Rosenbergiella epipactidis]
MKYLFTGLALFTCSVMAHASEDKLVIAHRGASGYLPEHTLPAKAMAYAQGADYLEQDVVMTRDDQLVVLHDHFLDRVTDVAQQFPNRHRADGRYYAIDFTLAEIRQLHFTEGFHLEGKKQVQNYPGRFPMNRSEFRVHTLAEELEFIQGLNHSTGKNIGIYTEIKSPWFHRKEGKDISKAVLITLKQYGYTKPTDKAWLQCFDYDELQRIKQTLEPQLGMDLKRVQLIAYTKDNETQTLQNGHWRNYDYDWMMTPEGIEKLSKTVDGIGPDYHMLIDAQSTLGHIRLTPMVTAAHRYKLPIHPYTVRSDQLPNYVSNVDELYQVLYQQADVPGLFTDFPDKAVSWLARHPQAE